MAKKQIKDSDLISEQETKGFTVSENTVEETTQDDLQTPDVPVVEQLDLEYLKDLDNVDVIVDILQTAGYKEQEKKVLENIDVILKRQYKQPDENKGIDEQKEVEYDNVLPMNSNLTFNPNPNGAVFTKNNDGSDIDGDLVKNDNDLDIDTKNNSTFYEDEYKVLKREYKQLEMQLDEYKRANQQKEVDYNLIAELRKSNLELRKLLSEKK